MYANVCKCPAFPKFAALNLKRPFQNSARARPLATKKKHLSWCVKSLDFDQP